MKVVANKICKTIMEWTSPFVYIPIYIKIKEKQTTPKHLLILINVLFQLK